MTYDNAERKAWSALEKAADKRLESVRFLGDEYSVDIKEKKVFSLSCNIPAKQYVSILILHYLIRRYEGILPLTGEWIAFTDLDGGNGYYPTFKKRVIEPLLRKHGAKPESLIETAGRLRAKKADLGDVGVIIEPFEGVPLLITIQRADDEFGPEANVLFDKSIKEVFCTEDIVVLAEFVAVHI